MNHMLAHGLERVGKRLGIDAPYFAANGSWVIARQIIVALASLGTLVLFARYVSSESLGNYQLAFAIFSMALVCSLPGMGIALVQAAARGRDGFYQKAFHSSIRGSIIGIGLMVGAGIVLLVTGHPSGWGVLVLALLFPFLSSFGLWESFFQGKERFDLASRSAALVALLQLAMLGLVVYLFSGQYLLLILAYGLTTALANIAIFCFSRTFVRNNEMDEQSVQFGYFMTKMNGLGMVAEQIDKVLIGVLLGPAQLAIYTIVSFFGTRIKEVIRELSAMLVPKMILDTNTFWGLLKTHRLTIVFLSAGIFAAAAIFFFAIQTVNIWLFSNQYGASSQLSLWYVITILLSGPLTVMGYYIYAKQNTYAITLANTVFHILRILLILVLIPLYGLLGAVLAYNISLVLLAVIYIWGIYVKERSPSFSPQ